MGEGKALDQLAVAEQAFASQYGLHNLPFAKKLNTVRSGLSLVNPADRREQIALWVVAPCLAAFAFWARQQTKEIPHASYLGVMREGRLLAQLMTTLFDVPAKELWLNRDMALRSAFGAGDDEALLNWLVRTRLHPLSEGEAIARLTGDPSKGFAEDTLIDLPRAQALMLQWRKDGRLALMREQAQKLVTSFLLHWDSVTQGKQDVPILLDFACAGNIQRSLRAILQFKGRADTTLGLNFLTTAGVCWAKKTGCTIRGFLADGGSPEWFSLAYARTPELIEIFTAAPTGALIGYDPKGAPLQAPPVLGKTQETWITQMQPRLIKAAQTYATALGSDLTVELGRCLWGRLLLQPLRSEAEALGDWPLDGGMDGGAHRLLAPSRNDGHGPWPRSEIAWPAATQVRSV